MLVKIGALLAPNYRVAIGDREVEGPTHDEHTPSGSQDALVDGGGEGEGEGREENADTQKNDSLSVSSVVSGDSEFPGVPRLEERGEREGEWEKEGDEKAEKLYEILREQVKAHKEGIGADDEIDRFVHMPL